MRISLKIFSSFIVIVMLFSHFDLISYAESSSYNGFTYELVNDEITITGYKGTEQNLVIPEKISSKPVTAIKKEAFRDNTIIKSVEIPNSVLSIGSKAFAMCSSLASVKFGSNVNDIGFSAFYGTAVYKSSTDKDGGTYLNNCLLHVNKTVNSKEITSYSVKAGTRLIAQGAFYLDSLTYTAPSELVYEALKSISIPSSVEVVNSFAFYGCVNLTKLKIADGVKYIDKYAFEKCESLESIVLPETLVRLEKNLFNKCNSLKTVAVNGNPELSECAFNSCPKLSEVSFSQGLKKFSLNIFYTCTALESITLPASVTKFENNKAENCNNLKTIKGYKGSAAESYARQMNLKFVSLGNSPLVFDYEVIENGGIVITDAFGVYGTSVEIPSMYDGYAVKEIGKDAFKLDNKIVDLFLPDGIRVKDGAFSYCVNLRTVSLGNNTVLGKSFNGCKSVKALIIPNGTQEISANCFEKGVELTVYGCLNSYAQSYAEANSFAFENVLTTTAPECYQEMLKAEIDKLEKLDKENYTEASFQRIAARLNELKALSSSGNATIDDIKNALVEAENDYNRLETAILFGDANCDGLITVADAKLILQHIAEIKALEGLSKISADVNKDEIISLADAKRVLQLVAGMT